MDRHTSQPIPRMTAAAQAGRRPLSASRRCGGSAYVLVLGCSALLTAAGLGAVYVARSDLKSAVAARDWGAASTIAASAAEIALARINNDSSWRKAYKSGAKELIDGFPGADAAGFIITDEADGDLSSPETAGARLEAFATVGDATRRYSVELAYRAPPSLAVLNHAVYAGNQIYVSGAAYVDGGLTYTPGTLYNNGNFQSNVKAGAISNTGAIVGQVTTGAKSLSPLSDGSLTTTLAGRATEISYAACNGQIRRTVLSAGQNDWGPTNSAGIYLVRVPSDKTLEIEDMRIVGTFMVVLNSGASLKITKALVMEPGSTDYPTLVIDGRSNTTVEIEINTDLQETGSLPSYNPPHTPYQGQGDWDTGDRFTSEIRGVIHIFGSSSDTFILRQSRIYGCIITEGDLAIGGNAEIYYDPQLLTTPPLAYRTGPPGMIPVAGTWQWSVGH